VLRSEESLTCPRQERGSIPQQCVSRIPELKIATADFQSGVPAHLNAVSELPIETRIQILEIALWTEDAAFQDEIVSPFANCWHSGLWNDDYLLSINIPTKGQ
jgi:hypothetical protein